MFNVAQDWNPKQSLLRQTLEENRVEEAKILLRELHSSVHSSMINEKRFPSYMDEIWNGLSEKAFKTMPSIKDVTIAWNIWHITRIEDITVNILIADTDPILNNEWLKKLNTDIKDTGNAMNKEEILSFSDRINFEELKNYRNLVGIRTKQVIEELKKEDFKRKFEKYQVSRILTEGGLVQHPESIWLLDFWGKKTVSGIILMPVTRHQIVHLNDSQKLKMKCSKILL